MTTQTAYFPYDTGFTMYLKEVEPIDATWANGITTLTETGSTGEYVSDSAVDVDKVYGVFLQDGGSPASTDDRIADLAFDRSVQVGTTYRYTNKLKGTDLDEVKITDEGVVG